MSWRDEAVTWSPSHGGYPGSVRADDRYPGLAVEDGRLGEMVARAADEGAADETVAVLLAEMYPGGCEGQ